MYYNYEPKLLVEETKVRYGYDPTSLPADDHRWLLVICRYCGKVKEMRNHYYQKAGKMACHDDCYISEQIDMIKQVSDNISGMTGNYPEIVSVMDILKQAGTTLTNVLAQLQKGEGR